MMQQYTFNGVWGWRICVPAVLAITACSTTHYRESADSEVYRTIAEKVPAVPGIVDDFDIDSEEQIELDGLPINTNFEEFLGEEEGRREIGAHILSLEKALDAAFKHSRDYQLEKEGVYLQALSLTLDRYEFQPMFSAGVSAEYIFTSTDTGASTLRSDVQAMTGSSATLLQSYHDAIEQAGAVTVGTRQTGSSGTKREESVSASASIGVDRLLTTGGRLAIDLSTNVFQFLTGSRRESASSTLTAVFTQPLLRGRGKAATEFLTQAERNLLYRLRDFTRFRKTFAVQIASEYYRVLQSRDNVRSQFRGLERTRTSLDRELAFMEEGLTTPGQVARLRQSVLDSESSLANSIVRYKNNLDNFKILLGLPVETKVILDDSELTVLAERGLVVPNIALENAVEVALVTRLDLITQQDSVADAERQIEVAANQLGPDLNLIFTGTINSKDNNRLASLDFKRSEWSAGFDLDLPLNRKAERNSYRRALINFEAQARQYDLSRDRIILQVRDAWRTLESDRTEYDIAQLSLGINRDRLEEEEIKSELGQSDILDLVDAQEAFTNAETNVTNTLINYTITLLNLWRDIGILYIKPNGQWEEVTDVG